MCVGGGGIVIFLPLNVTGESEMKKNTGDAARFGENEDIISPSVLLLSVGLQSAKKKNTELI